MVNNIQNISLFIKNQKSRNLLNKGKYSLTSLEACFILDKLYWKAIWSILIRWLASNWFTSKKVIKSFINVSLSCSRGLEAPELTEDCMPFFGDKLQLTYLIYFVLKFTNL